MATGGSLKPPTPYIHLYEVSCENPVKILWTQNLKGLLKRWCDFGLIKLVRVRLWTWFWRLSQAHRCRRMQKRESWEFRTLNQEPLRECDTSSLSVPGPSPGARALPESRARVRGAVFFSETAANAAMKRKQRLWELRAQNTTSFCYFFFRPPPP